MDKLKLNEVLVKLALAEQRAQQGASAVRQQTNAAAHAIANLNNTNGAKNHD